MRGRGGEEEEEDEQEKGLWACQAREGALIWYYEGQFVVTLGSVQEPPTVSDSACPNPDSHTFS